MSCCSGFFSGCNGCNGGRPGAAWSYWVNTGIVSGGLFNSSVGCRPYSVPTCNHHTGDNRPNCTAIVDTPACTKQCRDGYSPDYTSDLRFGTKAYGIDGNVQQIQQEILTSGPVEADFNVYDDFPNYKSGVYVKTSDTLLGAHAIKIIGWGVENGVDYWLVVNSWYKLTLLDFYRYLTFAFYHGFSFLGIPTGAIKDTSRSVKVQMSVTLNLTSTLEHPSFKLQSILSCS